MMQNPMRGLSRDDVINALGAAQSYSMEELRDHVGGNKSIKYWLIHEGQKFEAKVIIQLAWNLRNPATPISAADFRGDANSVAIPLRNLGFDVVEISTDRQFGHIDGSPIGTIFKDRIEASAAGVHRPRQAGISGSGDQGADSIVVSGGYVDDQDFGDRIIYTGHGGNDSSTKRQIADQKLERGNLALAVSCDQGIPIRVIRGAGGDPTYSPASGYRYDGLFKVVRYWPEIGVDGFRIWRFELQREHQNDLVVSQVPPTGTDQPRRRAAISRNSIARDPRLADWVKRRHDWTCQFCGDRISTPAGAYAEAAHIRPLGSPHNGPDQTSNLLCLCPNCHKRFDSFARHVNESGKVIDTGSDLVVGELRILSDHRIDEGHLHYHREQARMVRYQRSE